MPLPKSIPVEEWKRKIGEKVSLAKKYGLQVISTPDLPEPTARFPKIPSRGIYLVPPHGRLIWEGKKKAIVKTRRYNINENLILVSGKYAYGIISMGPPVPITKKEFDALRHKHQITEEEFKKWGWKGKQLYYYPVSLVEKFIPPKKVKLKRGTQSFISEVVFLRMVRKDVEPSELTNKELIYWHAKMHSMFKNRPHNWSYEDIVNLHVLIVQEMKKRGLRHINYDKLDKVSQEFLSFEQLIKDPKNYNPSKLSDKILLDDHRIVHAWWSSLLKGKKLYHADGSEITKEEVKRLHDMIVEEMKKRGFEHTSPLEESLAKMPSRVNDILEKLNDAVLIENFVSLIGSFITNKEKPNDIDFLLRFDRGTPEFIERAAKVRIAKMLENIKEDLHFTTDPEGPHDDYIPVYDLVLRKREPKYVDLAKKEKIPPERYFELEKKVVLGKPYLPQKPAGAATYDIKDLVKKIKPDVTYSVEKKLNGFHVTVHKFDNKVKIFSEQLKDLTVAFPTLTKEIAKLSNEDFIIDGELVPETGGRRALAVFVGAVKRGKKADDRKVKLWVWDITYYGKDIHNLPLEQRKKILKKLKFTKRVVNTPYVFAKGTKAVLNAVKKFSSLKDSEGAVLKDVSKPYKFGEKDWFKHRKMADIHVLVLKKIPTKNPGVYNYVFGIEVPTKYKSKLTPGSLEKVKPGLINWNGKWILLLGKTFNTRENIKEGAIIDVLVEEVWRHLNVKSKTIRYSVHKPRFKMIRPDISRTSNLKDLDAIVVSAGVEVKE